MVGEHVSSTRICVLKNCTSTFSRFFHKLFRGPVTQAYGRTAQPAGKDVSMGTMSNPDRSAAFRIYHGGRSKSASPFQPESIRLFFVRGSLNYCLADPNAGCRFKSGKMHPTVGFSLPVPSGSTPQQPQAGGPGFAHDSSAGITSTSTEPVLEECAAAVEASPASRRSLPYSRCGDLVEIPSASAGKGGWGR